MICKLLWQNYDLAEVVRRLRIILIFYKGRKVNGLYFVQCMKYCTQFKVALKEKMFWINVNSTLIIYRKNTQS